MGSFRKGKPAIMSWGVVQGQIPYLHKAHVRSPLDYPPPVMALNTNGTSQQGYALRIGGGQKPWLGACQQCV